MIIGNGLLGVKFKRARIDFNDYLIFTSGVSNSGEINLDEFKREEDLIIQSLIQNPRLKFIYFSSILAGVIDNAYYKHKVKMEKIISNSANSYIIFKLPQVIGKIGNKNNLVNNLTNSIKNGELVTIYNNSKRSLIDVSDVIKIVDYCKDRINRRVMYVSGIEKVGVSDIVYGISEILKLPVKSFVDDSPQINWDVKNSELVNEAIDFSNIKSKSYTKRILKKYIK